MKKILSWINLLIYLSLIFLFLAFLYVNKGIVVPVDYLLSINKEMPLSSLIFSVFIAGACFGLLVSWFLGLRSYWKNLRRNKELRSVKKDLETLQENIKL